MIVCVSLLQAYSESEFSQRAVDIGSPASMRIPESALKLAKLSSNPPSRS